MPGAGVCRRGTVLDQAQEKAREAADKSQRTAGPAEQTRRADIAKKHCQWSAEWQDPLAEPYEGLEPATLHHELTDLRP
ncbi:hypothetical protein GCM10011583_73750 [Streptomyces camponoticapitis]|uniref:Integrase n=1 Tax=Streptomyces camponoticapitis TaxID=1616125 RepID=A0ABQ2F1B8_9ACTN|nr:hypothetical protein [Streptomyces camponoticapitis]GGK31160.1 hypothetical protein GCM10011583_73750 [Streptomyces camponoticapitis]